MSWSKRDHLSKMKLMYPYICQAYKLENLFLQFLKFFFVKTASKVFSIFIGQNVEFLENISIKFSSQKAAVTYRVQVDFSNVRSTCFHEKNPTYYSTRYLFFHLLFSLAVCTRGLLLSNPSANPVLV